MSNELVNEVNDGKKNKEILNFLLEYKKPGPANLIVVKPVEIKE